MISQIIEMDKKAREATKQAKKEKVEIDNEIAFLKKKIREKHIERAREKIEKFRLAEQKKADKILNKISAGQKKIAEEMERLYLENKKNWAQEICKRVYESVKSVE
jgi:hypothetical protein